MRKALLAMLIGITGVIHAQYQGDGTAYRTIYLEELDSLLRAMPDHILVDVRSPGEFADTSAWERGNIGRISGAINIPIDSVGVMFDSLRSFQQRPVVLYCSHSQRSRRVAQQLADSGFTNVTNVNGGLNRYWIDQGPAMASLKARVITSTPYTLISGPQLCERITSPSGALILDVRSDSAFRSIAMSEVERSHGRLRSAINIPLEALAARIGEIALDVPIVVVDALTDRAPAAARKLLAHGAANVAVLYKGMEGVRSHGYFHFPCMAREWIERPPYQILSIEVVQPGEIQRGFNRIIDMRPDDEYGNAAKDAWKNIGRMTGAVHIPAAELASRIEDLAMDKGASVLIYGFSSNPYVFVAASMLADLGYTNVHVMANGLFGLRWAAANIKGHEFLRDLVENAPE
mgnify:FL=1